MAINIHTNQFGVLIDPYNGKLLELRDFDLLGTEPIFVENKLIIMTSDGDLKIYK